MIRSFDELSPQQQSNEQKRMVVIALSRMPSDELMVLTLHYGDATRRGSIVSVACDEVLRRWRLES